MSENVLRKAGDLSDEAVIERMRVDDKRESGDLHDQGEMAGDSWAREDASPRQLRRLDEMDIDDLGVFTNGMNHGIAHGLYGVIFGEEDDAEGMGVSAFWDHAVCAKWRERIEDQDFAQGFIEGALNVCGLVPT